MNAVAVNAVAVNAVDVSRQPRRVDATSASALAELELRSFDVPWSSTDLATLLARDTIRAWALAAAEARQTELIAYACCQLVLDDAELLRIAVDRRHRRRGLSHLVLAWALNDIADQGATSCHLEVRADNVAARALYCRHGFEVTGRRRLYYDDVDALLMRCNLPLAAS